MDIITLLNKSCLKPPEVQIVIAEHQKHYPNIRVCKSCPSQIRAAVKRLKQHYDRG